MPNITVKNIPDDLYKHLKKRAILNRRSINSEIIVCIERTVRSQKLSTEDVLTHARQLRDRTGKSSLSDSAFNRAKTDGRL